MTQAQIGSRIARLAADTATLTRIITEVKNCTYVGTTGQKDTAVHAIQEFRYSLYRELAALREEVKNAHKG